MEDLFDNTRDRWQRSYRYPLYLRSLWVLGLGLAAAAVVFRWRLRGIIESDPRIGWPVVAVLGLAVLWTVWKSVQGWKVKILVSPTSIKACYLGRGRERISWDSMAQIKGKWRLLGHSLTVVGTDGGEVSFRSSLKGYDEVLGFIRAKAPQHIVAQLNEFLEEDEEEDEEERREPEPVAEPAEAADELEERDGEEPAEESPETPEENKDDAV